VLQTTDERVWRFRHEVFREVASHSTSFSRRRHLHGAIADHLPAEPDADPGVLELHLAAAGRTDEAYPLAVTAARSAAARGAAVAAADLYERAVAMA
jgi:predicted ATPase